MYHNIYIHISTNVFVVVIVVLFISNYIILYIVNILYHELKGDFIFEFKMRLKKLLNSF